MEKILFAPLTKVVEQGDGTLEVWGRAAAQEADPKGEVFDYEASKPFIKNWSDEIAKASGGQSLGNLRAMHNPRRAAGKLTGLTFNDAEQAVDVVAKVVDANEVKKVQEGVYTGFSFGGSYGAKRQVGNLVYYTAVPSELSLADNPMIKSARFTLVKVDGSEEQKEFMGQAEEAEAQPAGELAMNAGLAAAGPQAGTPGLQKAGARHTAAEMRQIQQIHDTAASLGAACQGGMEKMATPMGFEQLVTDLGERLGKVEGAFAAQGEQLAKVETENADLKERLAKVEAQPAPAKGALKAVAKGEDVQPLAKTDGPTQDEMVKNNDTQGLIKAAHANPIIMG